MDGIDKFDVPVPSHGIEPYSTDTEDRNFRWIQNRGKGLDPESSEICQRKCASRHILRPDGAVPAPFRDRANCLG